MFSFLTLTQYCQQLKKIAMWKETMNNASVISTGLIKKNRVNEKCVPMKSIIRRPSEALPAASWKKVSPYGKAAG